MLLLVRAWGTNLWMNWNSDSEPRIWNDKENQLKRTDNTKYSQMDNIQWKILTFNCNAPLSLIVRDVSQKHLEMNKDLCNSGHDISECQRCLENASRGLPWGVATFNTPIVHKIEKICRNMLRAGSWYNSLWKKKSRWEQQVILKAFVIYICEQTQIYSTNGLSGLWCAFHKADLRSSSVSFLHLLAILPLFTHKVFWIRKSKTESILTLAVTTQQASSVVRNCARKKANSFWIKCLITMCEGIFDSQIANHVFWPNRLKTTWEAVT